MAYNVSVLGKDFIDGCPELSREEAGLVKFYADSNKCDYKCSRADGGRSDLA